MYVIGSADYLRMVYCHFIVEMMIKETILKIT